MNTSDVSARIQRQKAVPVVRSATAESTMLICQELIDAKSKTFR
jgi:hypothetical protein